MSSFNISFRKEGAYGVRNMRSQENKKDDKERDEQDKEDDKVKVNVHMTGDG